MTPVFRDGVLVGMVGTIGHVSDIGSTEDIARTREVFEEGVQIPPLKPARAGQQRGRAGPDRRERAQPRTGAGRHPRHGRRQRPVGAARLLAFMEEYGVHDLRALAKVVQGPRRGRDARRYPRRARRRCRSTISNNPAGTLLTYPVAVTVAGETIEVDFAGCPPQLARRVSSTARSPTRPPTPATR